MAKSTKSENKNAVTAVLAAVIIILVLVQAYSIFYYANKINAEYSKNPDREWLIDNCKCVEYNGIPHCLEGFELVKGVCRNGTSISNRLIACSRYKCPEYFVDINESLTKK